MTSSAVASTMTERDLQSAVIDLAHLFGWTIAHFRPARTEQGWRTPVEADGAGFPDLFCVRGDRALAAELKSNRGKATDEQSAWLAALSAAGIPTYLWRPQDWLSGDIEQVLRRPEDLRGGRDERQ